MLCRNCDRTIDQNYTKCPYCYASSVPPASQFERLILSAVKAGDEEKFADAIRNFNEAIKLEPTDPFTYVGRGDTFCDADAVTALLEWEEAEELEKELKVLHGNTDLDLLECAIKDYDKALSLDSGYAWAYSRRGHVYRELNEHERAIEDYDKALSLDPENVAAYDGRGDIYNALFQCERAIEDYDKALSLDPEYYWTYVSRGDAYAELDKFERAFDDYDKALSLNPENVAAYVSIARLHFYLGQRLKAIQNYDKALLLDPDDLDAQLGREDLVCYDCDTLIDNIEEVVNCSCPDCENKGHEECFEKCDSCAEGYYCNRGQGMNGDYSLCSLSSLPCNRHHCTDCGGNFCTGDGCENWNISKCFECGERTCMGCERQCSECGFGPYCSWDMPSYCSVCKLMWCEGEINEGCPSVTSEMGRCGNQYCQGMFPCGHHDTDMDEHCVDANTKTS